MEGEGPCSGGALFPQLPVRNRSNSKLPFTVYSHSRGTHCCSGYFALMLLFCQRFQAPRHPLQPSPPPCRNGTLSSPPPRRQPPPPMLFRLRAAPRPPLSPPPTPPAARRHRRMAPRAERPPLPGGALRWMQATCFRARRPRIWTAGGAGGQTTDSARVNAGRIGRHPKDLAANSID